MSSSETKTERLFQIETLLLTHPHGFTQAELARRLGVNRSTIMRYLPSLMKICNHSIYEEERRLVLDRSAYVVNVRLTLHEATAVHLAARLLTQALDRQNPHAASALRKLGLALESLAPHISRHMQQSADSIDEAARWNDQGYLRSLEVLTDAWAEGRKVRVWYRKERNEAVEEYVFCPYFIEPAAVGRSTYVFGLRQPPDAVRTFKIERFERVELLDDTYIIPAGFDPRQLLEHAWGIWYSESEPEEVVLRFSARVSSRLGETRWHRSEQVTEEAGGSLLWRAFIAAPREMMPWIRGWGADCEVLQPQWLREKVAEEMRCAAGLYDCIIKGERVEEGKTDR